MKKLMTLFNVSAAALLLSGPALAGNTATVHQSGSAVVVQSGNSNTAHIVQGKKSREESKEIGTQEGQGNRSFIRQSGENNVARQAQEGQDNIGLIDQQRGAPFLCGAKQ